MSKTELLLNLNPEHTFFQNVIIHAKEGLYNNKVIHNFGIEKIKIQIFFKISCIFFSVSRLCDDMYHKSTQHWEID